MPKRVWGEKLDLRWKKRKEWRESGRVRNFIICTFHQLSLR
jgi:hypothetical protein